MTDRPLTVLVIGSTGSVGRLVVDEAWRAGHQVQALVRSPERARDLPSGVQVVVADLTRSDSLADAVPDVDAVVFTHGSNGSKADMEAVDYGGVRSALTALGDRPARVALMTLVGVTNRSSPYNDTEGPDWKRRSERLVRASGRPYTIVRPGWFDHNAPDEQLPVFLQGDRRRAGSPADGAISRRQIAQVLVARLRSDAADRKTFELVAARGEAPGDLDRLFAALDPDGTDSLDGVRDEDNLPLAREPARVRADLDAVMTPRAEPGPGGHTQPTR
jgi:uncharacterized protein YbjT (DUF2867 family)